MAITMIGCQENEKKEPEIRLADYDHPISTESTEKTTNEATKDAEAKTEDTNASAVATVVEVSLQGTDQMTYNKTEIQVPAGSTVKLTLTHTGTMPATAMGHNFVLLKNGTEIADFSMKAIGFPDNDYIPKDTDKVIAHTKIIGGGESTTIEFKAPAPGTYTFICSFPGHYSLMKGTFTVK